MFCSNCGQENPATNLFCGMCGTPLPQRPITAPGAQSTLRFTRLPVESRPRTSETSGRVIAPEGSPSVGSSIFPPSNGSQRAQGQPESSSASPELITEEPPAHTLGPASEPDDAQSLRRFVEEFKYEPPTDSDSELTMFGVPLADRERLAQAKASATTSATTPPSSTVEQRNPAIAEDMPVAPERPRTSDGSLEHDEAPPILPRRRSTDRTDAAASERMPLEQKPDHPFLDAVKPTGTEPARPSLRAVEPAGTEPPRPSLRVVEPVAPEPVRPSLRVVEPASPAPVRSSLGVVEPVAPESAERSRFLDLNEPVAERPPQPVRSTIVGPSFLGLSDAPPLSADEAAEQEVAERPSSHWRLWSALAIFLIFGVLGLIEWRSQTHQTNGPLEVMKMEISRLKRTKPADTGSPNVPSDSNAKPEIQVEPQTKPPDTTTPPPSNANSGSPAAANPTGTTAPGTKPTDDLNTPIGNQPPAGSNATPQQQKTSPPADADTSNSPSQSETNPKSAAPKQSADEASTDTVATAAKPKRTPAPDNQEVVTRKIIPGEEEMIRANNASDSAAAAVWLRKAMAKGNPDAPVRLADMYIRGEGVPRDCDQAVVFLKAAAKTSARARTRLASMYATGNCVSRDRVQAYHWASMALAADPNSEWAQQNRDLLWRQMTADERAAAAKDR